MLIRAGCGHVLKESEGTGISIEVVEWDDSQHETTTYITVCNMCYNYYCVNNLVIQDKEEDRLRNRE